MNRLSSSALAFAFVSLVLCIFRVIEFAYFLANQLQYDPDDDSTAHLKEVNNMPALFSILLLVEVVRATLTGTLIFAVLKKKYLIVYIWILTQTVYVMFFYIIMPLVAAWYRYVTQTWKLVEAWITFPFYCLSIYVMILFYARP